MKNLIEQHKKDIKNRKVSTISNNSFFVNNPIDIEIKKAYRNLVAGLTTAMKQVQYVTRRGINKDIKIGFFFQSEENFNKEYEKIIKDKNHILFPIIEGLKNYREISDQVIKSSRNPTEHPDDGFLLPNIDYNIITGEIIGDFYSPERLQFLWEHSWRFCEETIIYSFSTIISPPSVIAEIPKKNRDKTLPIKYKIWLNKETMKKISEQIKKQKTTSKI